MGLTLTPVMKGTLWRAALLGDEALVLLLAHIIHSPGSLPPYTNQILPPVSKGFPCSFGLYAALDKVVVQCGDHPLLRPPKPFHFKAV